MINKYTKFWGLLVALIIISGYKVSAQTILTPRTVSMGGGGTAYLTGYSANFLNPANLMIPDQRYNNGIGLGEIAFFLNKQPIKSSISSFTFLFDQFTPKNLDNYSITSSEYQKILTNWFPDNTDYYNRSARYDAVLLGLNIQTKNFALSLALRSRGINRMTINRGWYDNNFVKNGNLRVLSRELHQTIAVYHELSLGFAEQLPLINGWTAHLNRMYVGIAPKLIFGGTYFKGDYSSDYYSGIAGMQFQNVRNFSSFSTGPLSNELGYYNNSTNQYAFPDNGLTYKDAIQPTGLGAGLDLGLTYIISLGNDATLLRDKNSGPMRKSFRLSASLTDIGFIRYNKNIKSYQAAGDTLAVSNIPGNAKTDFLGSPSSFSRFISNDDPNGLTYNNSNITQSTSRDVALPAALHIGSALQMNWWMATVDFTYGLNNNAFNSKYLITNIGGELRVIPYFPLRAGIQLQKKLNPIFDIGAAIDTPHFEISTGFEINTPGLRHNTFILGSAVTAVHIRF
jgi:hypothetical protein